MLKNPLFFLLILIILIYTNMLFAFENIIFKGNIIFHGAYKIAGLNSLNLENNLISTVYPYTKDKEPLLLLPQKNQIVLFKHNFRQRIEEVNFLSLNDKSISISINLEKYYGPYSVINSADDDIIIFSCIGIDEKTYLRGKASNIRGRYNYNKSILFSVDLKKKAQIDKLYIPYIQGNLALSPNNQKVAFDYLKFVEENDITFDEVVKSGVGIISLSEKNEGIYIEGISFYKWSPNGDYISYLKNSILCIENIRESTIKQIKISGETLQYAWSPNSKYIVLQYLKGFYGVLSKTILIDIKNGKTKMLLKSDQFLTDQRHFTNIQWIK